MRRWTTLIAALSLLPLGCSGVKKKDVDEIEARLTALETNVKALAAKQEEIAQVEGRITALKGELEAAAKAQADQSGKRIDALAAAQEQRAKAVDEELAKLQKDQASLHTREAADLKQLKDEVSKTSDLLAQAQSAAKQGPAPPSVPPTEPKASPPAAPVSK